MSTEAYNKVMCFCVSDCSLYQETYVNEQNNNLAQAPQFLVKYSPPEGFTVLFQRASRRTGIFVFSPFVVPRLLTVSVTVTIRVACGGAWVKSTSSPSRHCATTKKWFIKTIFCCKRKLCSLCHLGCGPKELNSEKFAYMNKCS